MYNDAISQTTAAAMIDEPPCLENEKIELKNNEAWNFDSQGKGIAGSWSLGATDEYTE